MRRLHLLAVSLLAPLAACGTADPGPGQAVTTVAPSTTTPPTTAAAATTAAVVTTSAATTTAPEAPGPGYTLPRDATDEVRRELTPAPVVASPGELAQRLADALLVREKGCEVAPTATVGDVTEGEPATAVVTATFGCDDSVGGARYTLTMGRDAATGWTVTAATREDLCVRGGAGTELCV